MHIFQKWLVSVFKNGYKIKNEDKVVYIYQKWKQNLLFILVVVYYRKTFVLISSVFQASVKSLIYTKE